MSELNRPKFRGVNAIGIGLSNSYTQVPQFIPPISTSPREETDNNTGASGGLLKAKPNRSDSQILSFTASPTFIHRKPGKMGQLNIRKSIKDSLKKIRFRQLIILLISWIIIIHYFERTTVANHIKKCDWSKWEHWPKGSNPHHSIIIGDPQIVDKFSYPNRSEPILKFTQRLSDNYLHRNHQIYHKLLTPDTTLYIGDLFDGGREWENDIWYEEYKRFNEIFNPITNTRTFKQIPGNHDIGFGNAVNFTKYNRFRSFFGDSNDYFTIGNHSLILLDTISLSSSENPDINTPSSGFLQDLSNPLHPAMQFPRLLLTHVPLYRFTEKQTCGPLRESKKKFPVMRGKQYQTVLEYELSQKILNIIKPKVIFSGDDHDYCHIRHPLTTTSTTQEKKQISGESFTDEITVKTSAMTGGIKKPAIQLISMWNPQDDDNDDKNDFEKSVTDSETGKLVVEHDTFKSRLCYLPDPYLALKMYTFWFILTSFSLLIMTYSINLGSKLNNFIDSKLRKRFKNDSVKLLSDNYIKDDNKKNKVIDIITDWKISKEKDLGAFIINLIILTFMIWKIFIWYFNEI